MPLRICNLAGVFTGEGFVRSHGRRPTVKDCGFIAGPVNITCAGNGRIESITAAGRRSLNYPGESLDGTSLVATAGFIDPHTHALFSGGRFSELFLRWQGSTYLKIARAGGGISKTVDDTGRASIGRLRSGLEARLREMLRQGCTTVEIKSGYADTAAGEVRLLHMIQQTARKITAPRIFSTFLGLHAPPPGAKAADYCREMIGALKPIVRGRLAVCADSFPEAGFFSLNQSLRFSQAALELGLGIKVHADELSAMGASEAFIRLGALSIDHLQHISSGAIALLSNSPTVATLMPCTSFYLGLQYADARALVRSGARVALASDFNPGTSPLPGLRLTLLLAANLLRISAPEIFCACTYNAAAALGKEQELGALLPGFHADIVLWRTAFPPRPRHAVEFLEELILSAPEPVGIVVGGRRTVETLSLQLL